MARYSTRDLLGHFVKPESRQGKMCPHACCRNRRVHPDNYPVVLPDKLLKRASDEDLAQGYSRGGRERQAQILAEMDRRDQRDTRRRAAKERHTALLTSRKYERYEEEERLYIQAENATRGHMVNRAGRAADIDPRSLFTGPESRARRYASEELLEHWQSHGRPTGAYFAGKNTTVHERATARRPRYRVTSGRRAA